MVGTRLKYSKYHTETPQDAIHFSQQVAAPENPNLYLESSESDRSTASEVKFKKQALHQLRAK